MIISAPAGIGEVTPATDLIAMIIDAAAADDRLRGLRDGDVVVVTSKIISKAEGMTRPAEDRLVARREETVRTVARKLGFAIVATRHGLVQAGAGIDNSNVAPDTILVLPVDPDASAARLRAGLVERTGVEIGVIISDTAGRAWRLGQTDHAIGSAGIVPMLDYEGREDPYGNPLRVTLTAVVDELAGAADLVKGKLAGRPVAVVRGLGHLLDPDAPGAATVTRPVAEDLFRLGSRESVLMALLESSGAAERYEELVELDDPDVVVTELGLTGDRAALASAMLRAAYAWSA